MHHRLYILCLFVALLGVVITSGCFLHAGEPGNGDWWLRASPFWLFAVLPYGGVAGAAVGLRRWLPGEVVSLCILAATGVTALALASYFYADAFFLHPTPQAPMMFLGVPMLQWMLVALLLPAAWLTGYLFHRHGRRRAEAVAVDAAGDAPSP